MTKVERERAAAKKRARQPRTVRTKETPAILRMNTEELAALGESIGKTLAREFSAAQRAWPSPWERVEGDKPLRTHHGLGEAMRQRDDCTVGGAINAAQGKPDIHFALQRQEHAVQELHDIIDALIERFVPITGLITSSQPATAFEKGETADPLKPFVLTEIERRTAAVNVAGQRLHELLERAAL